ncbi:MAG TPA: 4-hydroxybenzoate octaprenyltransferase [Candidatus Desulfofervidus auxilii]|uniref:4-hydroxybenzoate polyprenyltransferase n=1 Tax=Desulfofervidus auxilii TaxID=1621989 RepID=A0A7C0U3A7_DESA2|nr:4-hydroxybenzoate octaprenyltransferase [Candidatus Desulfofervidus auxilii]
MFEKLKITLNMIKFEHSIFALPFAFIGAFLAQKGIPPLEKCFWILIAMVSIRSAAMAFNRVVDMDIDAKNPRTKDRALPKGLLTTRWVHGFIASCIIVFFISTYHLNQFVFHLSPYAVIIATVYSYTKRFTWLTHLFLGIAIGLAPLGGWLAIKPSFEITPLLLMAGVAFWVAGFDIIYACLDYEFDKKYKIHSIPVRFGIKNALYISAFSHFITILCFYFAGKCAQLKPIYFYGLIATGLILMGEHLLVKPSDLSKVNVAFFTFNGIFSIVMFLLVCLSLPWI